MGGSARIHVPIRIRWSEAKSVHGGLNIGWSGRSNVHGISLGSRDQNPRPVSLLLLLPRRKPGPGPTRSGIWTGWHGPVIWPRIPPWLERRNRSPRMSRRTCRVLLTARPATATAGGLAGVTAATMTTALTGVTPPQIVSGADFS